MYLIADSEFFHCMKCNACVRNISGVVHKCLSHSIERTCPICQRYFSCRSGVCFLLIFSSSLNNSYMFDSVDKLKGLSCGHVMHLSCFCEYRGNAHSTCPICRSCAVMAFAYRKHVWLTS